MAALAVYGCQVEDLKENTLETIPEVIPEAKVFTATIEDNTSPETRTSLDAEGNVLWKQYDQVSIFAGSTINEHYQVTDASDGQTAATLNKVEDPGFVAGTDLENNVAFYPYASTASIAKSGGSYIISNIELPASQNYAAGSFGNGAFPMAAVTGSTGDMNLKFKNILGGLKLQLKGTATIASISLTGNNNEILYGDAEVTATNGSAPSISLTDASAKTVTLDCGAGVALDSETATSFIIALPPITMTGGFTVVVTDTEGKQMEISTSKSQTITRSSLLRMPAVNYVGMIRIQNPLTFESTGETSISLAKVGSPDDISLEYRINNGAWTEYIIGSVIDLTNGSTVSFRSGIDGNNSFSKSYQNYYNFVTTGSGSIAASGNIMSLLGQNEDSTISISNCFYYLFQNCTALTTAPTLPATTLANYCYSHMFYGCTSLTTAPTLPATTLAEYCYSYMFQGCTSLTTAPTLSTTTLANDCYCGMFQGCTNLTTAPALPATTLASGCYFGMFQGCTNLTTAPALPATTLASGCYSDMFNGCSSLTTAPALPATTLASGCYDYMFQDCTSLTTAPDLPSTTLAYRCYAGLFWGCSNLTSAPELPATTLAQECYRDMFGQCSKLTTAPVLPATTLVEGCYVYMFYNCKKLNYLKALFTSSPYTQDLDNWLSGVSATGTFVKSGQATWNNSSAGIPSGWTVQTE